MGTLNNAVKEYKNCSLEILSCLEDEEFELLNNIFDKRTEIINEINKINYSQDEFLECCSEYGIVEIEKDIETKMNLKRNELLKKMSNISKAQNANNSYNRIYNQGSVFFSKKI